MAKADVAVIGAGGVQAQAMLEAAQRAGMIDSWVAADRSWNPASREACEALGMQIAEVDVLGEPDELRALLADVRMVANFAGPFFLTGGAVLEACIDVGCDYLDICDDADATRGLLERSERVADAGVRALIGMGSSPGVTNVLVKAAFDYLGGADRVELCWIVDIADVNDAALQHFWHIFTPLDDSGEGSAPPAWEQVKRRSVVFPEPLGEQTVIELSHPEPITVPRFLGIEEVRNYGGIVPEDTMVVNWALARLGAGTTDAEIEIGGSNTTVRSTAQALYSRYLETREQSTYLGGGLVVDVHNGDRGLRFSSADETSMEESTGVPAAAGIVLMLEGEPSEPGMLAPECLDPGAFFPALGRASRGTGSLKAHELRGSEELERVRIRDLLKAAKSN